MESTPTHDSASQTDPYARQPHRVAGDKSERTYESNLWKENHGNLLLCFTAILCLIGAAIIAYQQARFNPPSFPSKLTHATGDGTSESHLASGDVTDIRTIELRIIGAASDEGFMRIAMYLQEDGFNDPKKAFEVDSWHIVGGVCAGRWEMPRNITAVAIAAYHDANGNGELDKNSIGIPSERYGFTGGARGIVGPPSFQEAVVTVDDNPIDISIR